METYAVTIGDGTYEIDAPDKAALRKAVTRLQVSLMGEENARRLAPAPTEAEKPSNTPRSILASAYLGGAQPTGQARKEFERGEAGGAIAVPMITGAIAAPVAAAKMLGSGATGFVAGEATHSGLKRMGVNDTVADYAGTGVSMLLGGGTAAAIMKGGLARGIKGKILSYFAKSGKSSSPEVVEETTKIVAKIMDLKNTQKLSDGQIINVLRELYAIPAKDARALLGLFGK